MSTRTLNRQLILEAAARSTNLPVLPRVTAQVEKEIANPKTSAARVAAIIKTDPALSAAMLRIANSAIHAPRREICDITQAISQIGLKEVHRVTLVTGLVRTWPRQANLDLQRFWTHSVAVGLTTAELTRTLKTPLTPESNEVTFMAGLLHDLGALVLFRVFPEECMEVRQLAEERGCPVAELELERWSIDHGEVAKAIAERWNLPEILRPSMAFHHRPWLAASTDRRLVQVVHIADFFCNNQGVGRTDPALPPWFDEDAWESLGFQLSDVNSLVDRVCKQCSDSTVWSDAVQNACR